MILQNTCLCLSSLSIHDAISALHQDLEWIFIHYLKKYIVIYSRSRLGLRCISRCLNQTSTVTFMGTLVLLHASDFGSWKSGMFCLAPWCCAGSSLSFNQYSWFHFECMPLLYIPFTCIVRSSRKCTDMHNWRNASFEAQESACSTCILLSFMRSWSYSCIWRKLSIYLTLYHDWIYFINIPCIYYELKSMTIQLLKS